MSQPWDVIIIGAGVIGSSAAWRFARRGHRVLLLEQHTLGHDRGSSHGESRIIRLSYDEPLYTERMPRAYELWGELERASEKNLVHTIGGVDLGSSDVPSWRATRDTLEQFEITFEELDRDALSKRFPQFRTDENESALWQAETGILPATLCVRTLIEAAMDRGAKVREQCRVQEISADGDRVQVTVNGETIEAGHLVVAAGGWSGPLLERLGLKLPLEVTEEFVAYFRPNDPSDYQPERFPVFIRHEEEFVYGFPIFDRPLVKVALHHAGEKTTAEGRIFEADIDVLDRLEAWVEARLPGLLPAAVDVETCLYTNTPDRDFIVDRHPDHERLLIAAGFSGHGFKFGPWIGEALVDMVEGGSGAPHERFRIHRFG
ncbi:MAG: N-methyl-L-tryptophan oxidase [Planctomycetota bacterium]